jgi:hypothetical protein
MTVYANIYLGRVWEIIEPAMDEAGNEIPLSERYTAAFCGQCVDITGVEPVPQQGWAAIESNGTWTFSAPLVASSS